MPRDICSKCNYPTKTCLCSYITPVDHKTKIIILQHPSEVDNKKNTIRLLSLLTNNIKVIVGESEQDFAEVEALLKDSDTNYFLLYPSEKSKTWNEYLTESSDKYVSLTQKKALIMLDGTWRKAKKIHLSNPWLKNIPNLTLISDKKSSYGIRKSNLDHGLSSIEAVAYALEDIEQLSPTPFLTALNGLKTSFTRLMPKAVKQRYDA